MIVNRCDAVLFDLDGTLIDSMPFLFQAVATTVASYGRTFDHEYFRHWHGNRVPLAELLAHHRIEGANEAEFRNAFGSLFLQQVGESVEWMPGAEDVLRSLQSRSVLLGVITNAPPSYLQTVNTRVGLTRYCSALVTPQDVGGKPKPHPDGLLFAAQSLGVDPQRCLYVGDQQFDMLAAKNAGIPSVLIRTAHSSEMEVVPDYEFKSVDQVKKLFEPLIEV